MINIKQRLQPLQQKWQAWWGTQTPRDQWIIKIVTPLIVIILMYTLIWLPLSERVEVTAQRVAANAALLEFMQDKADVIAVLQRRAVDAGDLGGQPLLSAVDDSTRGSILSPFVTEIAQAGEDAVRVRFTEAPFDELMIWLEYLWSELGVSIDQVTIDRVDDEVGLVNVRVTLVAE